MSQYHKLSKYIVTYLKFITIEIITMEVCGFEVIEVTKGNETCSQQQNYEPVFNIYPGINDFRSVIREL